MTLESVNTYPTKTAKISPVQLITVQSTLTWVYNNLGGMIWRDWGMFYCILEDVCRGRAKRRLTKFPRRNWILLWMFCVRGNRRNLLFFGVERGIEIFFFKKKYFFSKFFHPPPPQVYELLPQSPFRRSSWLYVSETNIPGFIQKTILWIWLHFWLGSWSRGHRVRLSNNDWIQHTNTIKYLIFLTKK